MAFNALNWSVWFSVKDNNGNSSGFGIELDGALTEAQVIARANVISAAYAALGDGYLATYNITKSYVNDAADPKTASSEVERKLSLTVSNGVKGSDVQMSIPSPIFGLETAGTDVVVVTQPQLAAFLSALYADGTAAGGAMMHPYRNLVMKQCDRAVITHRARKPRR